MGTIYDKFKTIIFASVIILALVIGGAFYYINQNGFSGRWTLYIEEALKEKGITAKVESFRYSLIDGFISSNLTIFDPEDPEQKILQFKKIAIKIENQDASKGKVELKSAKLMDGEAWISLEDEESNRVHVTDIECEIDLNQGYDVFVRDCSATVYGIPITAEGSSLGVRKPKEETKPFEMPEVILEICRYLYEVSTNSASAPTIDVSFLHEAGKEKGLDIDINVKGEDFSYRALNFRSIDASLNYSNYVLTVSKLECLDDTGPLSLQGTYHVKNRKGDFQLESSTNVPKILRAFSINTVANKIITPLPPKLKAQGSFKGTKVSEDKVEWKSHVYGHAVVEQFRLLGTTFNSLDTEFSWKDSQLYLRDMAVKHDEGEVSGKILIMDKYIRYEAHSNLPPHLYEPFIKDHGIIADNISKTTFTKDSSIDLSIKGSMRRDKLNEWEATGTIVLEDIAYNNVPLKDASTEFQFSPSAVSFDDIAATFDYTTYIPSQYAQKQPSEGIILAERIKFSPKKRVVSISNLTGKAWIAPIINLFNEKVGTKIDNTAYFTSPPFLSTNGEFALKGHLAKTNLVCQLNTPSDIYYNLLGKDVRFNKARGEIRLLGQHIHLDNVSAEALSGTIGGNFRVTNKSSQNPKGGYQGNVSFSNVSLIDIAERYEFDSKTKGALTGRMSFKGRPNETRALQGEGFIALDQADLFYIPIFGPLSPILSAMLGDKKTSHERVSSVSANFVIKNGDVLTNDISSVTPSADISGHGKIDLQKKEMDITVRTKTRGLLGFITLPLKPFEKLLQFRGTGPISDPKWANAAFNETPQYLPEKQEINRAIIVE